MVRLRGTGVLLLPLGYDSSHAAPSVMRPQQSLCCNKDHLPLPRLNSSGCCGSTDCLSLEGSALKYAIAENSLRGTILLR